MDTINLTRYRTMKKLSQTQLSILSELDLTNIQRIESGKNKNPSRRIMIKIAQALEVTPQEIFFPEFCSSTIVRP